MENVVVCRPIRGFTHRQMMASQGLRPGLLSAAPAGLHQRRIEVLIRRWLPSLVLIALMVVPVTAKAAQASEGSTYSVVISGLGGEPEYEKLIQGWGKGLFTALKKNALPEGHLFWLAAKKEEGVYAESRRDEILKLFGTLAGRIEPHDVFELFLIGHGSFDEYEYRFNIPGPDLAVLQLSEMLGRIRAERQVVVNMTSSSGASLAPLRRKGRVIITSTSVGRERNFSVFARYFNQALEDSAADANKNQGVSALEAFQYANREVARYYESLKRLATEHPMLEDRGEGEGVREPNTENGEGLLAASIMLVHQADEADARDTPEARNLRAQKRKIEEDIESLKYRKASMPSAAYAKELERLLVSLAETQKHLDELDKK